MSNKLSLSNKTTLIPIKQNNNNHKRQTNKQKREIFFLLFLAQIFFSTILIKIIGSETDGGTDREFTSFSNNSV